MPHMLRIYLKSRIFLSINHWILFVHYIKARNIWNFLCIFKSSWVNWYWNTVKPVYNSLGYNSLGYNSLGYNWLGYNSLDYNSLDYNSLDYNSLGYNSIGYNSIGYNWLGHNSLPLITQYIVFTDRIRFLINWTVITKTHF
jgi:hypothetical protein